MNEDPTRLMDYGDEPPRRRRPPQQPKGNLRLAVLIMGVIIFGLLIGLISSCGGGGTKTVTETKVITEEVPATGSKEKESGEKEEAEEGAEGEESTEEQERREIEEAEAAEGEILEEPEGGGVGTE